MYVSWSCLRCVIFASKTVLLLSLGICTNETRFSVNSGFVLIDPVGGFNQLSIESGPSNRGLAVSLTGSLIITSQAKPCCTDNSNNDDDTYNANHGNNLCDLFAGGVVSNHS